MRALAILFVVLSFFLKTVIGKTNINEHKLYNPPYLVLENADSLLSIKNYDSAAFLYNQIIDYKTHKPISFKLWYNAACANAKSHPLLSLSILNVLYSETYFDNYNYLIMDKSFDVLHLYPQWKNIISKALTNQKINSQVKDTVLSNLIDSLEQSDQKYRLTQIDTANMYGWDSYQVKKMDSIIYDNDTLIENIVFPIIRKKDILNNIRSISPETSMKLFVIIQHSAVNIQEEWSSLIEKWYKIGYLSPDNYALFIDRLSVNKKLPQKYGTQIAMKKGDIYLDNYQNINEMRKNRDSLWLTSLDDYINLLEQLNHFKIRTN